MAEVKYKRAEFTEELEQILQLQQVNILASISEEESLQEGFVTVHHNYDILKAMNDKCAHIIAKNESEVIGYALCMLKEFEGEIKVLQPMFKQINKRLKHDEPYLVMGQICIDKKFRKQGVFRGLYQFMKAQLQLEFNMIITEVDIANTRSLNAHYALGFKLLHSYNSNHQKWALISWDLH
jgi:predicted GNAT superfamily acetyltransferase